MTYARKPFQVEVWKDGQLSAVFQPLTPSWVYTPEYPFPWGEVRLLLGRRRLRTVRNTVGSPGVLGMSLFEMIFILKEPKKGKTMGRVDLHVPWLKYWKA